MKSNKEIWVEYDFIDTEHGPRPYWIRIFKDRAEAEAFAATKADAKIVEVEMTEN